MKSEQELFSHFATVLQVRDISTSIQFYRDKLGFEVTFEWNNPVDYAVLKRGTVSIHLAHDSTIVGKIRPYTSIYVFVYDVDAVYNEFVDKKVSIHNPIGDRAYGMRDFDITDPDGFMISFGRELINNL